MTTSTAPEHPNVLPGPVLRYLRELELSIKQRVGVVPEVALEDAREYLVRDFEALINSEPGTSDESLYQHFVREYGAPNTVAEQYESSATPPTRIGSGYAPGWRICCTRCGRSAPAAKAGITRIAARSWHKYVLGWCKDCGGFRWVRLVQDLDKANLTDELALRGSGASYRRQKHRPWTTLFGSIALALTLCLGINLLVWWIVSSS